MFDFQQYPKHIFYQVLNGRISKGGRHKKIKTPKGKSRVSVSSIEVHFLKLSHSIEQNKSLSLIGVANFFPGEIRGLKIKFLSFQLLAAVQL